jgi:hypothetical protein
LQHSFLAAALFQVASCDLPELCPQLLDFLSVLFKFRLCRFGFIGQTTAFNQQPNNDRS